MNNDHRVGRRTFVKQEADAVTDGTRSERSLVINICEWLELPAAVYYRQRSLLVCSRNGAGHA